MKHHIPKSSQPGDIYTAVPNDKALVPTKAKKPAKLDMQLLFIEMRARGVPYDTIAEDLGIAKNTCLSWATKFSTNIVSTRQIVLDELCEKFSITKARRIETFGGELARIMAELAHRDLTDVSTADLYKLALRHGEVLREELPKMDLETSLKYSESSWGCTKSAPRSRRESDEIDSESD